MAKQKRIFIEKETAGGILDGVKIVVDTQTGVNYIFSSGFLTPLLDKNGNSVIDPTE